MGLMLLLAGCDSHGLNPARSVDINAPLDDGRLRLLEVSEGVRSVGWSPDGSQVATGSYQGRIIVWDSASGDVAQTLTYSTGRMLIRAVAFDPSGTLLASAQDNTIAIWDIASGQNVRLLDGHGDIVNSIAWSPDGSRLASGSNDRTVIEWDPSTGDKVMTLPSPGGPVSAVAWSPDGSLLASGASDGTISLWNASDGSSLGTLPSFGTGIVSGRQGGNSTGVTSLAFRPDSTQLASTNWNGDLIVWDVASDQPAYVDHRSYTGSMLSVGYSPDGKTLVTGSWYGMVLLWDADTGARLRSLHGHTGWVNAVAWSPDITRLASGSSNGTALIWRMSN